MKNWKLLRGLQRTFDGGDDLALHRKRLAGNARARRRRMAAAAKLAADFADVHLVAFRAQADARHFRFHFLEHAGDDDRLNGAQVVDQAFRVVALRAGAGEIFFLQPEPSDAVFARQAEFAVNMLEQLRARQRIGLINFVANFREVGAARDQFRAGVKRPGPRVGILERAGVRRDGGEQLVGNRRGDRPARGFQQSVNQFAGGRLARRHPVHVGVARVAFVMVNVDENFPVADALAGLAEPLEARAVGGDDAVEFFAALAVFQSARRRSRNLYFCGMASWFQTVTFLPSFRSASARPSCEPMQSPSGRTWPTMQKVLCSRMTSMIRSMIFG